MAPSGALKVCSTCKVRKRACDRTLPSCGYCTYRGLACQYNIQTSLLEAENNDASDNEVPPSYREFILSLKPDIPAAPPATNIVFPRISHSNISSSDFQTEKHSDFLLSRCLSSHKPTRSRDFDYIIHDQVHSLIRATRQFVDDVTVKYFRSIHEWIPVISRRTFQNLLIGYSAPPTADFSILLLSMCLITYRSSPTSPHVISHDSIYATTKMRFADVQALLSSSLNLVQAGILISIYEYAHGKVETAYNSIINCANMARKIGLHLLNPSSDLLFEASLRREEERNIWWAIVIYESKVILCDILSANKPLATEFPNSSESLPSESAVLDQNGMAHFGESIHVPISAIDSKCIGGFGRQAQAGFLLDQVLCALKTTEMKTKLSELAKSNQNLMTLLSALLEQSYKQKKHHCGSIAICIRALYVSHYHMLDQPTAILENWSNSSKAALDTLSKMVIDIADSCNNEKESLSSNPSPPTTLYIMQAALKYVNTNPCVEIDSRSKAHKTLKEFLDSYHNKWNFT